MRGVRVALTALVVLSLLGLPAAPVSARVVLSDGAAEGLDILAGVVDEQGVAPVDGGATGSAAVSATSDTGLVVSLPATGDGLVWLDDPLGFDLALGMPTAGSRVESFCPTDGWYLQDGTCLRRIAFAYVYTSFRYEWADFEYDYADYTYQERDYEYDHTPYTYEYATPTTHEVRYPGEGDCSYLPNPNAPGGLDIYCPPDIIEHEADDPPAGWDWNDDWSLWRRLLPGPVGWEDTGEDWQRVQQPPAGWFDSGWNWQQRDPTPAGWEDFGDDAQWRKRIDDPLADGWEVVDGRWRRLIDKPGWDQTVRGWRHLAPSPENYVIDEVSWVRTVPARQRLVGIDTPPGPDTSTVQVIHPAPQPDVDLVEEPEPSAPVWDTDAGSPTTGAGDGGVIDIAGSAAANVQDDGTAVYEADEETGSVAGQVLSDGSVRLAVTIPDEQAPRSFAVPLLMPDYMAPALQPDGRVLVMALLAVDDPATVGLDEELWEIEFEMPAPWAKDANGADVRTWYTMDGNTLIQHIEPTASTVWPVVADPTAKQNKQAAKARNQAKVAEKQADNAAEARRQAQAAQAKAARLAAAAEAKLLAARTQAKKREDLARQAKEKARAAKEAMELARAKAKESAEAAKKAAAAAKSAAKAAAALAASNAKKLAAQAAKDAAAAATATTKATTNSKTATNAATKAEQSKVSIQDSIATAKQTLAVYNNAALTTKQKIAATQPLLNTYANRVAERKRLAKADSDGTTTPGVQGRSLKPRSPDRTDAQLWADVTMEYLVDGRQVGFVVLGGSTDTVDVTVRLHNLGSTQLDRPLAFTLAAPSAAGDPDSASRISSRKELYSAPWQLTFEAMGCDGDGATASCVIPRIIKEGVATFGFRLLANPRQTRHHPDTTLNAVGGTTKDLPVALLQNRYQTEFDNTGQVEYLDLTVDGPDGLPSVRADSITVGIYGAEAASDLLEQAEGIATAEHDALNACGYGKTAEQYLAQWYKQLPNGDWALKVKEVGEGIGLVGTIKGFQYEAIERAFTNVSELVGKGAPLRKIADGMAVIGDLVEVGEAAGAYGPISCAVGTRLALAALGRAGPVGLVLSLATEQFLHLAADGSANNRVWLAQMRAGAKTGCTRLEWFDIDGKPRVFSAVTKPAGGAFEIEGSKAPQNDLSQHWVVSCKRAT